MSLWQGHPNWWAARPYICGGVAKAIEGYGQDPDFAWNWGVLKALGLWHTSYDFVRGGNCPSEAAAYIGVLRRVGYAGDPLAGPPVLDIEVRDAYGMAVCLALALHGAFGVWPVIYTAPGTWPGGQSGNLQAWIATFGPRHGCLAWTCSFVAWQFASPPYVYFYVPGMGYIDESVDLGFTRERPFYRKPPPPPPRLVCFGRHAQLRNATCKRVRPLVARWSQARDATARAEARHGCRRASSRLCAQLNQRRAWFAGRAETTFQRYI